MTPYADNAAHVEGELLLLNLLLHRHVLRWRLGHDPAAGDDELLGLFVSDREVDALLTALYSNDSPRPLEVTDAISEVSRLIVDAAQQHDRNEAAALAAGVELRLPRLAARVGLSPLEIGIVMLALAVEIDRRYGRLYAYLNDDAGARAPTVDLVLQVYCATLGERAAARELLEAGRPLRRLRLVELHEPPGGGTLLDHSIRLDPAVASFLLGGHSLDGVITGRTTVVPAPPAAPVDAATSNEIAAAARLMGLDARTVFHVAGSDGDDCRQVAAFVGASAMGAAALLSLDLRGVADASMARDLAARAVREARLRGHSVALELGDDSDAADAAVDALLDTSPTFARFVISAAEQAPHRLEAARPVHRIEVPLPTVPVRRRIWDSLLDDIADDVDLTELADRFRLSGSAIRLAAGRARLAAVARGARSVERVDLFASCRRQTGAPAADLVERVVSIHEWDDLVLPPDHKSQLRGLENWVRHRPLVFDEWGFSARVMLGRGLTVLFTGPAGTGKTMAAGILARHLGLEMYRVDLSMVVSKYIGETEKNLGSVFQAAEASNAILFFDEADALFGKRSEVKDAHDRYANIEVSYLLQRMEAYEGVAILATNFRDNLDSAFARRIHVTVEFPFPTIADRRRIWSAMLTADVPQADDVDVTFLARQFPLTGGHIKNCAVAAAFAAAADAGAIGMSHLVRAVANELEKSRQPVAATTFGQYAAMLDGPPVEACAS